MLELVLVLFVALLVGSICIHHYTMSKKVDACQDRTLSVVKKASEHSMNAANTVHPVIALMEATKAVQMMESLNSQYGIKTATDITGIDTCKVQTDLEGHRDQIVRDLVTKMSSLYPATNMSSSKHHASSYGETREHRDQTTFVD